MGEVGGWGWYIREGVQTLEEKVRQGRKKVLRRRVPVRVVR